MTIHIIVSNPVEFIPTYKDEIAKFHNEYQKWITDNFGYEARYEFSYTMVKRRVYFDFAFKTKEDAMAFKLRWM